MDYLVTCAAAILYLVFQTVSVYGGDSGELVSSAWTWGISHPPGYPLFNLLGGILSHGIPWGTVAWRVGLLSSIPMAAAMGFLAGTVSMLTGRRRYGILAAGIAALLYPVWLYAVVPEVFGLYAFFSSVLLYLFAKAAMGTMSDREADATALVFGLSLTHHHLIVLLPCAVGIALLWRDTAIAKRMLRHPLRYLLLCLAGFLVYAYAPIVSAGYPPFDREHPATLTGFLRMFLRSSYGTFRASYMTGDSMADRWLGLIALGQYLFRDFTVTGIGLAAIGTVSAVRRNAAARLIVTYAVVLVAFLFYAGFPVQSDFSLGTVERFFIVPYLVFSVLLGIGISAVDGLVSRRFSGRLSPAFARLLPVLVGALGVVISVRSIALNGKPLLALRGDRTFERMTDDIFSSVPRGGILMLSDDTTDFATNYGYYVQRKRSDIVYLNYLMMREPYYRDAVARRYPQLRFPAYPRDLSFATYLNDFFATNSAVMAVTAERQIPQIDGVWVPSGMTMRYYPPGTATDAAQIIATNSALWKGFSDPRSGVLGVYRHLMMTDILRVYSDKLIAYASFLFGAGREKDAVEKLRTAIDIAPFRQETYQALMTWQAEHGECSDAAETVTDLLSTGRFDASAYTVFRKVAGACPEVSSLVAAYLQQEETLRKRAELELR